MFCIVKMYDDGLTIDFDFKLLDPIVLPILSERDSYMSHY
jgi:hypothetical protein